MVVEHCNVEVNRRAPKVAAAQQALERQYVFASITGLPFTIAHPDSL
jgi:hypothetical protein